MHTLSAFLRSNYGLQNMHFNITNIVFFFLSKPFFLFTCETSSRKVELIQTTNQYFKMTSMLKGKLHHMCKVQDMTVMSLQNKKYKARQKCTFVQRYHTVPKQNADVINYYWRFDETERKKTEKSKILKGFKIC